MSDELAGADSKKDAPRSATDQHAGRPRNRSRRATVAASLLLILLGASCMLLFDYALVPFSRPQSCAFCHEMQAPHASWQQSPHYVNRSGVQVSCVECHLPHKDDRLPHLAARVWSAGKDLGVHFFGQYDAVKSRQRILQTLPSDRCTRCHANLAGCPSARPVAIVHAISLQRASERVHACVTCHDTLHGPPAVPPTPKTYEPADNSYCLVCHINLDREEFASVHVKAGIDCIKCHGSSDDHAADEEHLTAPDIIFAKSAVNASCLTSECHPRASMEAEIGHRPFFAGADPQHAYCTDCHGQHMVPNRTRRWDKQSRQLIEMNATPVSPAKS